MRITNELKEKITRQVNQKFQKQYDKLNAEYTAIVENEKAALTTIIMNGFAKAPELTILLKRYSGETVIANVQQFISYVDLKSDALTAIKNKLDAHKTEKQLFLENFLINVSYEKDIGAIRQLFADNELSY